MKRALYLALFLAITAALTGGILSFVNDLTKDTIAAAQIEKEKENLVKIFPNGEFVSIGEEVAGEEMILDLFEVVGGGYVYKLSSNGYGGEILYLVGFDADNNIKGVSVINHGETPGFGDVIERDEFTSKYVGKGLGEALDVYTGATVSSNAINKGINAAAVHLSGGNLVVEEPDVNLGKTVSLSDEKLAEYPAEILSKEVDGDNTVYVVRVDGYGAKFGKGQSPDYKENEFEITLDADGKVVGIKLLVFGDTPGLGDQIDNSKYYELYMGIDSTDAEVDVVSNATVSSYSLISAVKTVLEDY